jgi:hypothetical protein
MPKVERWILSPGQHLSFLLLVLEPPQINITVNSNAFVTKAEVFGDWIGGELGSFGAWKF